MQKVYDLYASIQELVRLLEVYAKRTTSRIERYLEKVGQRHRILKSFDKEGGTTSCCLAP